MVQAAAPRNREFDGVSPEDVVFGETLGEGKFLRSWWQFHGQISNLEYYLSDIGAFGLVKIGWLRSNPSAKYAIKSMKKHEII